MAAEPDIRVTPVTPELAPAVRALRVAAEQYAYVGDIEVNLLDAERTLESEAMANLAGDTVIGFYRIDHFPSTVTCTPLGPGAVGLHSFLLDRAWHGRGLAARAVQAVCDDLRQRHRQARVLALNSTAATSPRSAPIEAATTARDCRRSAGYEACLMTPCRPDRLFTTH